MKTRCCRTLFLYFRLLSARLSTSEDMGPLTPAVSALAAAILQLTLDTSPAAAHQAANQLNGLAARPPPPGEVESARALLAHGTVLHDLLPATNGIVKELLAAPSQRQLQALRTLILTRQADSRATARQFRLLLYAASLVLVGLLPTRVTAPGTGIGVTMAGCVRACDCRHLDATDRRPAS